MSVSVEKSSLTKGAAKACKASSKIELITPITSPLMVVRNQNRVGNEVGVRQNKSNNNNNNNTINGNSGIPSSGVATTVRQSKPPPSLKKKKEDPRPLGRGRRRGSGSVGGNGGCGNDGRALLQRLFENASRQDGLPNSASPTPRPSGTRRRLSGNRSPTVRVRNNLLNTQQEQQQQQQQSASPSPASPEDENDGACGGQGANCGIPSECSSLNSSIAQTPHTKDLLDLDEDEERERLKQEQPLCDDTERLTPYDEEDEEEAVQRYMGNREGLSVPREAHQNGLFSTDSTFEAADSVDGVVVERFHTPRSKRGRPRRVWRERSCSSSASRREIHHPHRHGERSLPDGMSDSVCRTLSLYDAFFLDEKRKLWLVDDIVLTRCLDYVGLMDYERPMSHQRQQPHDALLATMCGQLSSPIWCKEAERPHSSGGTSSRRWALSGPPCCTAARSLASTLFLDYQEAERWLSEQEYVVGAILACCARVDGRSPRTVGEAVPYLTPSRHPILQAAVFVLDRFPHWGGVAGFVEKWEQQVGLVLGTAAPSHQRVFRFQDEGLLFSSDMEGGNLARVERARDAAPQPTFNLWMEPDLGCEQRLWFRFAIAGVRPHSAIGLRIVNIQPNTKLYLRNGMRPVWRAGQSPLQWTPVGQCVYRTINNEADGELTFVVVPRTRDVVHVAFCVPYTYADLLCHITHWHHLVKKSMCGIRFEERVLCHTQDGRKLHLLVITSPTSKPSQIPQKRRGNDGSGTLRQSIAGPYAHFENGKKVVLLSSRVHPGEVTASHGIHGAISFLLSNDPHATLIRDHFIFYIVPMLNPDGVSRGHSRLDQNGFNLNRCYNCPDPQTQPTVNALRKVFEHLQQTFRERFFMYMDFHSHASQSSGFMFGNCLPVTVQHWNMVFPKIVSLHAKDVFSYQLCRFGRGHMTSKEGSSRVLFGGSLIHSYTVELTHFSSNRMYVDGAYTDGVRSPITTTATLGDGDAWEARYANTLGNGNNNSRRRHATTPRSNVSVSPPRSRSARLRKPPLRRQGNTKRRVDGDAYDSGVGGRRDTLRHIEVPCVLSQSAEVGRGCLMALLDYCAVEGYASPQFAVYGGIERVLREVKRNMSASVASKPPAYRLQLIYKQY